MHGNTRKAIGRTFGRALQARAGVGWLLRGPVIVRVEAPEAHPADRADHAAHADHADHADHATRVRVA